MPFSWISRRVAPIRTDVSEEISASRIRVTGIGELGKALAITSKRIKLRINISQRVSVVPCSLITVTLMMEAMRASETSALARPTRRNIPEGGIIHSDRRENLKSYRELTGWTLWSRRNMSPVKYELGSYIPEDDILHSHCRDNLISYKSF
jgi:hypothetical protein